MMRYQNEQLIVSPEPYQERANEWFRGQIIGPPGFLFYNADRFFERAGVDFIRQIDHDYVRHD
jgi:hypothetical protein